MAQVHQAAQSFTEDEWEDIRARVKADEELTQKLQVEERDKYSEIDQAMFKETKDRKRLRTAKESRDELSQEQLQQLMIIVPEEGMNVEALQTKYSIIDWEVSPEDSRKYGKIIRVEPTEDKERELWVELKRLFEPDDNDILWKLQRYMHDPLKWRLYDTCVVHHVSTKRGHDIFMLVEKDYPLTRALMTLMLSNKLQVDEYSVMMEPDINSMTLNEYLVHEGRHRNLARNYISRKSGAPVRNRILVYLDSDKENEDLEEILDDLFKIGAENIRKIGHEVPIRCDDKAVGNTDHENGDQKDGELPDFLTSSVTNVFASVCEQVDENIDISIAKEKEEVPMEDVEVDKDPFLVFMDSKDQSNFVQ
ncbi:hypothetical protein Tco_1404964 [Tanacetum coccineum]